MNDCALFKTHLKYNFSFNLGTPASHVYVLLSVIQFNSFALFRKIQSALLDERYPLIPLWIEVILRTVLYIFKCEDELKRYYFYDFGEYTNLSKKQKYHNAITREQSGSDVQFCPNLCVLPLRKSESSPILNVNFTYIHSSHFTSLFHLALMLPRMANVS